MIQETQKCRACQADIVFLHTRHGRLIPVNAATVEPGEDLFEYTKHVSHFATCTDAARFRRSK